MDSMQRTGILVVAVGYGLAFVAMCLSACLMGPAAADHGCCPGEDGIRAAERDCCSVTPGVTHGGAQATATSTVLAADASFTLTVPPAVVRAAPITVSASPPRVLRV
jgi:hypothetical protein